MSIEVSIDKREKALIAALQEKQAGIYDRTGKGSAAEELIEEALIRPFLPPRFECIKGAVMTFENPEFQSPAIDRIVYDKTICFPLVYDRAHSIFPIEMVSGLVEITMNLDRFKLKNDIEKMISIKKMERRRYLIPAPGSPVIVYPYEQMGVAPRSFIIGLPDEENWSPETIGRALMEIQRELGPPTHVHGLYVIGIGFFWTIPDSNYNIRYWTGPDRLFRFAENFRQSFDRWGPIPDGWVVDLRCYVESNFKIIE